jgi:hypothetical protein
MQAPFYKRNGTVLHLGDCRELAAARLKAEAAKYPLFEAGGQ